MAFSVGRRDDPADVERTVALARVAGAGLAGYATWLWLPAMRTMILDEVKRAPSAPPGTVELLIARSLAAFAGRADVASLGLAPIAGTGTALAARALRDGLGVRSASPGLLAFKAKFRPRWEPRYLVVERWADVPAVLLAVLLLHHPALLARSRGRAAVPRALIR
jgi:phosphatidylglycerol lysyltransferase